MNRLNISRNTKAECEIDGCKYLFDACSDNSLEYAKQYYGSNFKYIGSSNIIIYDGNRQVTSKLYHFFIKNFNHTPEIGIKVEGLRQLDLDLNLNLIKNTQQL